MVSREGDEEGLAEVGARGSEGEVEEEGVVREVSWGEEEEEG